MKMLSREKIIFHILFGASHGTPVLNRSRDQQTAFSSEPLVFFHQIFAVEHIFENQK